MTQVAVGSVSDRQRQVMIDVDSNRRTQVATGSVSAEPIVVQASADGLSSSTLSIPTTLDDAASVLASAAASTRSAYLL